MNAAEVGTSIAGSLNAISRNLKQAVRDVAKEGAKVAREEHYAEAKLAAGPDRRFSRFKGPALGVKAKYDATGVQIIPTGPWKIAEEGAAPHDGHPGTARTQGKQRWTKGRDATTRRLDTTVPQSIDRAVQEGFTRGK